MPDERRRSANFSALNERLLAGTGMQRARKADATDSVISAAILLARNATRCTRLGSPLRPSYQ